MKKSTQAGIWAVAIVIAGFLIFSFVQNYSGAGAFGEPEGGPCITNGGTCCNDTKPVSCPEGQACQMTRSLFDWWPWFESSCKCLDIPTHVKIEKEEEGVCGYDLTGNRDAPCTGYCPPGQSCRINTENLDELGPCVCR